MKRIDQIFLEGQHDSSRTSPDSNCFRLAFMKNIYHIFHKEQCESNHIVPDSNGFRFAIGISEKTDKIFLNEQYRSSHIFFDLQKENMGQTLFSLIKVVFRNV